ncbi:hypothetical protein [Frigidibacter sp. MR17.24]|uniref:hypothetical protein n=1 Tax=Frigidibacter sp. MR17.24 TaxID=3127345 RepID=UPI0030131146
MSEALFRNLAQARHQGDALVETAGRRSRSASYHGATRASADEAAQIRVANEDAQGALATDGIPHDD